MASNQQANIIRKIEVIEGHGHHGGAWKVAYADFMTAMMAFFLLMWILSSSDEQKLRGIAEYFTNATLPGGSGVLDGATLGPPGTLTASNGNIVARGSENGKIDDPSPSQWEIRDTTPTSDPQETARGTMVGIHDNPAGGAASAIATHEPRPDATASADAAGSADQANDASDPNIAGGGPGAGEEGTDTQTGGGAAALSTEEHAADVARLENLRAEIMQSMQDNPDLAPLTQNLIFEVTPEGMEIQIVDQEGKPMFASGSAGMVDATETLLTNLGQSLSQLPNPIVISGHTDGVPFSAKSSYDNWDLSSDRANATRRVLEDSGVPHDRIRRVSGLADTDLLVESDPHDPSNRRISIQLQYLQTTDRKPPVPRQDHLARATAADHTETSMASSDKGHGDTTHAAPATHGPEDAAPMAETMQTGHGTAASTLDEKVFEGLRSALR